MPVTPDMDNGFRPVKGQTVRVAGRCHPRILGKIVQVVDVDEEGATISYEDEQFGPVSTWGQHGGLEPVEEKSGRGLYNGESAG